MTFNSVVAHRIAKEWLTVSPSVWPIAGDYPDSNMGTL